jgi:hypothetical protein
MKGFEAIAKVTPVKRACRLCGLMGVDQALR